jgi:ATP synthase F1 delta subunit
VAAKESCLPQVRADLQSLSEIWQENKELTLLLLNPRLSKSKGRAMLVALFDRMKAHEMTRNYVHLLVDKDRLDILPAVFPSFEKLWREHQGEIEVTVTTAIGIPESLQSEIRDHLARKSGKKPLIRWENDTTILGGLIVQWPDRVFDGSLARKLVNLKDRLAEAV